MDLGNLISNKKQELFKINMKRCFIIFVIIILSFVSINYSQNNTKKTNSIENQALPDNSKKTESFFTLTFSTILDYIKEIITIIGLLFGLFWGFPILRKKLQEDQIKDFVKETQQYNKNIRQECHKLIEKHTTKQYKNIVIGYKELQNIYLEICEIDLKAFNTSKEISSLVFLLKNTFQGVLRHYNKNTKLLTTGMVYPFYLSILSEIIFFATKVVLLPEKASTEKFRLINKKIDPYLSDNTFRKYKYFEIGLNIKATSPVTFLYFSLINKHADFLFQRASYQIMKNVAPIAILLFFNKIYFPIILERNEKFILSDSKVKLYLIGFQSIITHSTTESKKSVDFYYSNLDDTMVFVKNRLKKSHFISDYKDIYIKSKQIDLPKINSFATDAPEILKVNVDQEYVQELFKDNKKKIKKKMKKELKIL